MKLWPVLVVAFLGGFLWLFLTAPFTAPASPVIGIIGKGDLTNQALTGRLHDRRGSQHLERYELGKAMADYQQALKLARESGDLEGQADALNNLAVVDYTLGTTSDGCENYARAAAIYEHIEKHHLATSRKLLYSRCLMILGDMAIAWDVIEEVYQRCVELDDVPCRAAALRELGWWFYCEDQTKPALEHLQTSIALDPVLGTYDRLGSIQRERGKYADAAEAFRHALAGVDETAEIDKAHILANLCDLYLETDQIERGRESCDDARELFERAGAKDSLADVLHSLAQLERRAGELRQAEKHLMEAVELIEELRPKTDLDRHRIPFLEDRIKLFHARITVRMELDDREPEIGWHLRALTTHDQMRARGLLDKLDHRSSPTLELERLQAELDDDTWILVYHLDQAETDPRHVLWRVSRGGVDRFRLSVDVPYRDLAELWSRTIEERRDSVSDQERKLASKLADALLSPLGDELTDQRLVIVADSDLQRIPFAALLLPAKEDQDRQRLLSRHEVVMLPSLSFLMELRRRDEVQRADELLGIFVDPVSSAEDERLEDEARKAAQASEQAERTLYPRLIESGKEGRQIHSLAPRSSRLYSGFDVELTALRSGILSHFSILHFATHGRLDEDGEPALILSRYDRAGRLLDGALKLSELGRQELPSLELAVLSACQTAVGEAHRGEGMLSLAHGLMQAGAPRVIVSLWRVPDTSTRDLMARFYHGLLLDELTPPAALRRAQLALWRQGLPIKLWGGFVLQGDWEGFSIEIGNGRASSRTKTSRSGL